MRKAHQERLRTFALDRTERMARGEKHPVRDFLFEYYAYRPAYLLRWSPGFGVTLENARLADVSWPEFTQAGGGMVLDPANFPQHRLTFLNWATHYLEGIAARPPLFACFGLHEWAMVYRDPNVRHSSTPLRLPPEKIAEVVESETLCCTHFDAYRFFSKDAVPRNRISLNREITDQHDQRGCVHVTMDLYRYAYKLSPWIPGELLAEAFELAWKARELDMRASPYDLSNRGYEPIKIETQVGKEEYVRGQRELAELASPIRTRLIESYRELLSAVDSPQRHKAHNPIAN